MYIFHNHMETSHIIILVVIHALSRFVYVSYDYMNKLCFNETHVCVLYWLGGCKRGATTKFQTSIDI
jgi:hypothetical protein